MFAKIKTLFSSLRTRPLVIQHGRLYRNAEGDAVRIVRKITPADQELFRGYAWLGDNAEAYTQDGRFFKDRTSKYDLVKEIK